MIKLWSVKNKVLRLNLNGLIYSVACNQFTFNRSLRILELKQFY